MVEKSENAASLNTVTLNLQDNQLIITRGEDKEIIPLYSKEAFEIITQHWLKVGWDQKYVYTFSWLGRPIIQLPEDMIRAQELVYKIKPDVIIETGIAHGGSLIFNASLCKLIGKGRVIGVDIEIRPHNRKAIEEHPLFEYISLIEDDAISPETLKKVSSYLNPKDTVLVFLDSNHSYDHVLSELKMYGDLVTRDSYLVATDGIQKYLHDVPRGQKKWCTDNPLDAVRDFLKEDLRFKLDTPSWVFNESPLSENVTHWPGAYLRRVV